MSDDGLNHWMWQCELGGESPPGLWLGSLVITETEGKMMHLGLPQVTAQRPGKIPKRGRLAKDGWVGMLWASQLPFL